jgi:prepilin-type N-terminal cleavage/methylation domain-containing protein
MQKFAKKRKGFTVIELLMVVAIIGILATIIVVSVREASDRTRNTKIVTSITQIRKVAEDMYLQEAAGYTRLCLANGVLNVGYSDILETLKSDIENYGGSDIVCYSTQYSYCVSTQLTGKDIRYFCIDDEGNNTDAAIKVCASGNIKCE